MFTQPQGNQIEPQLVKLHTLNLNDERPLWEILGLATPNGSTWKELRIGELKTLLALAIGDVEAALKDCDWIYHYKQMNPSRRLVYRCVDMEGSPMHTNLLGAYDKLFAPTNPS